MTIKDELINKGVNPKLVKEYATELEYASKVKEFDFKLELMVELIERGAISYSFIPSEIDLDLIDDEEEIEIPEEFNSILYDIFDLDKILDDKYLERNSVTNVSGNDLFEMAQESDLYKVLNKDMDVKIKYNGVDIETLKGDTEELFYHENYDT